MTDDDQAQEEQVPAPLELDPSKWDEQVAVTGRPNDVPEDNSTLASRAKARAKVRVKEVDVPTTAASMPVTAPRRARKK